MSAKKFFSNEDNLMPGGTREAPENQPSFTDIFILALKEINLSFGDGRIRCVFEYDPRILHGKMLEAQEKFSKEKRQLYFRF
mgnify:CR=1 FL=1